MIYKALKSHYLIRAHRMMDARWQKRLTESSGSEGDTEDLWYCRRSV